MESSHDNNSTNKTETETSIHGESMSMEGGGTQAIADPSLSFSDPNELKNPDNVLYLQRTLGNQATRALVSNTVQRKEKTDTQFFSGLSITNNLSMMQRDSGDQIDRDTDENDSDQSEDLSNDTDDVFNNDKTSEVDEGNNKDNQNKGITPLRLQRKTHDPVIQPKISPAKPKKIQRGYNDSNRLQRKTPGLMIQPKISRAEPKKIQRGWYSDMNPWLKGGLDIGLGVLDATVLGGLVSWTKFVDDMTDKPDPETDALVYGEGKWGKFFKAFDKSADFLKVVVNAVTSLGVIFGFLSLFPALTAGMAVAAAACALIATIGHAIAFVMKGIMTANSLHRLSQVKKDWPKNSKQYNTVLKSVYENGASAAGSLAGLISGGILGGFSPGATASTIAELGTKSTVKAAATIGGSVAVGQIAGSVGDVVGSGAEITGSHLKSKPAEELSTKDIPDTTEDVPDTTEDVPDTTEPTMSPELVTILLSSIQVAKERKNSDAEKLIDLNKKKLPDIQIGAQALIESTGEMGGESNKLKEKAEVLKTQTDLGTTLASDMQPSDSETDANKIVELDEKLVKTEEELDLPAPKATWDIADGTLPPTEDGVEDPDVAPTSTPTESTEPEGDPETLALKRKGDNTQVHTEASTGTIQRGLGAKIKKKYRSIKNWMVQKLANVTGRIKRVLAKIKAKVIGWGMKITGLDKKTAELKTGMIEEKQKVAPIMESGTQASETMEQANTAFPELEEAINSKK